MRYAYILRFALAAGFLLLAVLEAHAQDAEANKTRRVIQFSGVVIGTDTTNGVPGVHIYVPKAGRGTTTNQYGYFSMPVLVGDSVVISAIGYRKKHLIIPAEQTDAFTGIITLDEDTTILPTVEVLPYPTEELFKEAILAMELPDEGDYRNMMQNLNEELMAAMFRNEPMGPEQNYRFYQQQQLQYMQDRYSPRSNPLLNPFNWANFIKSLKKKDK